MRPQNLEIVTFLRDIAIRVIKGCDSIGTISGEYPIGKFLRNGWHTPLRSSRDASLATQENTGRNDWQWFHPWREATLPKKDEVTSTMRKDDSFAKNVFHS